MNAFDRNPSLIPLPPSQVISLEEETYTVWLEADGVLKMRDSNGRFVHSLLEEKLAPFKVKPAVAPPTMAAATTTTTEILKVASLRPTAAVSDSLPASATPDPIPTSPDLRPSANPCGKRRTANWR